MNTEQIANRIAAAAEHMGCTSNLDVAGSGSCYLTIWASEDDEDPAARVRVSDHVHLGGGTDYHGADTDIEIVTTAKASQGDIHGTCALDAVIIIARRLGRTMPPAYRAAVTRRETRARQRAEAAARQRAEAAAQRETIQQAADQRRAAADPAEIEAAIARYRQAPTGKAGRKQRARAIDRAWNLGVTLEELQKGVA